MVKIFFKRLLPLILAISLLALLAGCRSAQQAEASVESQQTGASDDAQQDGTYPYQHALNIPDDNYRTYYEIFVSSFYDSDGDGIGDLNGVAQKLDYLNDGDDTTDSDLGFTGIWLMPIMPSPTYHKYDVTDFYDVDASYGTLEDFQSLLADCHSRGIKLIIDLPINHTSAQHPWFTEAVQYYESLAEGEQPDYDVCPYASYYHFSTEKAGATGWYQVGDTEWYYEGVFWDQMPDLALENELVRSELENVASFWLNMGVDGFRLDAVKEYVSGSHASNIEILSWFNQYVLSVNPDAYLVGEAWETNPVTLSSYYKSGVTSFFDFPLAQSTGSVAAIVNRGTGAKLASLLMQSETIYGAVNPDFIDAPFLSNHDTSRISAHYVNDLDKMKLAAGILLTMNGSPFVYYGEELGMNSKGTKDENKRLPMHWSDTDTTGTPLAPDGADDVEQKLPALDLQADDPLSLYNYYKRALRIRNENPEIARGEVAAVESLVSDTICAVTKTYEGSTLLLVYNIGAESADVSLFGSAYDAFDLYGYLTIGETPVTLSDGTLSLPAYAIAVLKPQA